MLKQLNRSNDEINERIKYYLKRLNYHENESDLKDKLKKASILCGLYNILQKYRLLFL